jgi:hypothetical protein
LALLLKVTGPYVLSKPINHAGAPSRFERVYGFWQLSVVLLEGFYKFTARKLVFMLNPCHVIGSWQAYLLLTDWKPWKAYAFLALVGWSFCP